MLDLTSLIVFLVVAFAAAVKGTLGVGFPLISTPVVAVVEGARPAIVIMAIPTLISNILILARIGFGESQARRFLPVLLTLVVGTTAGGVLLARLDAAVLSIALSLVVLVYVGLRLFHPGLIVSPPQERVLAPFVGFLGGLFGGTTNVSGPVLATYLHALKLEPRAFVGAVTLLFTFSNLAQVVTYTQQGLYDSGRLLHGFLYCLPMVAGLYVGMWLQKRINAVLFNRFVLLVLVVSSANLLYRGLTALGQAN